MSYYHVEEVRTSDHVADIVLLGERLHAEKGTGGYDRNYVMRMAIRQAMMDDRIFKNAWILYDEETPIGFFAAHSVTAYTQKGLYARHDLWYVIPERRGGRGAAILWAEFERWAHAIGATQISATISLVGDMSKVINAVQQNGLMLSDQIFTRELDPGLPLEQQLTIH